jgi:hypothetical protein
LSTGEVVLATWYDVISWRDEPVPSVTDPAVNTKVRRFALDIRRLPRGAPKIR